MKIPSIGILVSTTRATFKRFYTAILFATLASVLCILLFHLESYQDARHQRFLNMIMSCYLGMLLSIALTAFCERRRSGKQVSAGLQILTVILSVIYYFSLPAQYNTAALLRFELYAVALHLLIAFAPFTGRGEMNGFWQYNKTLFLRFLTTALYAAVLYAGLSLALLAIEELFKVNIEGKYYGDLWILTGCLFSTCFFLSGFPSEFENLDAKTEYPKGLKIFTQYILLPIITIYLAILYVYMFKILFTLKWPFGWVSYLVLALSIAGILSLLLIHPERERENNKWILIYSRFFYLAICPLILMLFLAIERRISDYGITEPRYFVLALALWLCGIVLYFLLSGRKNIKIIPVSLCCLAFLSSFGPWAPFPFLYAVSKGAFQGFWKRTICCISINSGPGKIPYRKETHYESILSWNT